ncbi:hypothetical protein KC327_g18904 [Hortaea werneckii]|uniref:RNA helicase n=1 Tax=Hortaea werneckii TaxID=91943 RepID=A0A3M7I199_HORWE|nr:hypothetical protein KC350_g19019 [Hortaea werneckii]KAI6797556.1 hypothetical protein KC358_g16374 [Hortaea werneckii]KAI6901813.1 hypothetical protein KC348_g16331 [Hortaea werneckii]KAI6917160.1 hypothetical protein KC341_g18694 [Hortaea werneckii]KAI6948734.1 hypothetical protein KC321_g18767 [Hortaea werneckii]
MLRYPFVCPPCEARAISRILYPWTGASSSRTASTLQSRRQPSRMTLSPNVARGPSNKPRDGDNGKSRPAARRSRNTPFGGMNITEPPRSFQDSRQAGYKGRISAAEQRRASRHVKSTQKSRGEGKDSRDPMKALKMQQALANVSYERRGRVKQELAERDSFDDFDLLPIIKESIPRQALGGMTDVSPTPIQRLAIPVLLGTEEGKRRRKRKELIPDGGKKEMQQFLLAAETGSGKTLAYILPIIDAIKRAEKAEQEQERTQAAQQDRQNRAFEIEAPDVDEPHPSTGRPRAIILLPTSELVAQVGALVKSLSHTVKFRSAMISSSYTATVIRSRLFSPGGIDIVISTPHLLSSITESDPNVLSRVTHLVIDEADSLLDRSFSPTTSAIVDRASPSLQQLVLCSATIPRSLDSYVHKRFPAARRLVTPNLHAIPRRVQLSVVDIDRVPYQGNRDLACAQTIWDIGKEALEQGEDRGAGTPTAGANERKIVVFVNEREKTVELASYLRSKGIAATALSRDSDERNQAEILAEFTGVATPSSTTTTTTTSSNGSSHRAVPRGRLLPSTKVLVMTDLGSRGIDTLAVKHVILYDVPHTSIDFIHRLGRVGRMGRRGRGVVLVGRHDRKDVVREVREGMFRGQALI